MSNSNLNFGVQRSYTTHARSVCTAHTESDQTERHGFTRACIPPYTTTCTQAPPTFYHTFQYYHRWKTTLAEARPPRHVSRCRKAWCYVHWQRHGPRKVQRGGPGARKSFSSQAPAALMSMAPIAAHGTLLDSSPVVAHQEPPPGSQLRAASQLEPEAILACGLSPSETAY